jgi:hypothetical protein
MEPDYGGAYNAPPSAIGLQAGYGSMARPMMAVAPSRLPYNPAMLGGVPMSCKYTLLNKKIFLS